MSNIIIAKILEEDNFIDKISDEVKKQVCDDYDLLLNYPVVYIHVWRNKKNIRNNNYSIYIGETNDIIERTKEHWAAALIDKSKRKPGNWQYHLLEDVDDKNNRVIPALYIIGCKDFNKSLTLDIEHRLYEYCTAIPNRPDIFNGRGNKQGNYSGDTLFVKLFGKVWNLLRKDNNKLFVKPSLITKSAIYRAAPNFSLSKQQKYARQRIIDRTLDAIINNKFGQLIFVEGEAGTGKTVLATTTFFDILDNKLLKDLDVKASLLINHPEQQDLYENIAIALGYDSSIIQNPTHWLNNHSILNNKTNLYEPNPNKIETIVFIDEGHLLWNSNNMSFNTKYPSPALDEIMKRARVTVFLYDENQVLHKDQFCEPFYIEEKRFLAKSQGNSLNNNYVLLDWQFRMNCSKNTLNWIDSITKDQSIVKNPLSSHVDSKGYEIKIFDNPKELHDSIKSKASRAGFELSRVLATYDWAWVSKIPSVYNPSLSQKYWEVNIDGWKLPWNEQLYHVDLCRTLSSRQIKKYLKQNWAEKDYTINEAGSTFTIQGFDLAFAGVILGPSVHYNKETKKIEFIESKKYSKNMKGYKVLRDGSIVNVTNYIAKHELRVLLTRANNGLYIYACDDNLRDALKKSLK